MRLALISSTASASVALNGTDGTALPVRITSLTRVSRRRPRVPPGCERAKSSAPKPLASSKATASASPIANCAVVLAVGARLSGQASLATAVFKCASANRARVDSGLPVKATILAPRRLIAGAIASTSAVSPELEKAITTSLPVIMPKSPWPASAGWTKNAAVPVEAKVAATLRAMCPDLPMPTTMTRPPQPSNKSSASANSVSMRWASWATAEASVRKTSRARFKAWWCLPGEALTVDSATAIMRSSIANVFGSFLTWHQVCIWQGNWVRQAWGDDVCFVSGTLLSTIQAALESNGHSEGCRKSMKTKARCKSGLLS